MNKQTVCLSEKPENGVRNDWSRSEVQVLFELPFNELLFRAQCVHRENFDPNAIQVSTLLSIKTGGCPEDCNYCPQSVHHDAGLEPEHLMLPRDTAGSEPVYRMYVIRCPRRDELQSYLAEARIWTGLAYVPPLHLQPVYSYLGYRPGSFPQTERVAEELLCLPTIPEISGVEVQWVAETIRSFFE